jgi:xanthine dehydrogenase YagS FAD-binding subunit
VRPFAYVRPTSLDDAVASLGEADSLTPNGTRALAGGTDLLPLMKADLIAPERLVDIKRLAELGDQIEEMPDGLRLGALTTLDQIEQSAVIQERYAALAEAAALAATPQLRNMATIGGNLLQRPRCWYFRHPHVACWLKGGDSCPAREGENQLHTLFDVSPCVAAHPSDPATALLALDASVRLRGRTSERELPLADFLAPPTEERRTETVIAGDELLISVHIPSDTASRSTYLKAMERKAWAFALVGVAVSVRMEGSRFARSRVVLGGVAPVPWRAEAAERVLTGAVASDEVIARAAAAALEGAQPLTQNGYKVPLVEALVRRALHAVSG